MSASLIFASSIGKMVRVDGDLNMTNSNASAFLAALGLDPDFDNAAQMAIDEFAEALRLFKASEIAEVVDAGSPTTSNVRGSGLQWIDFGRAPDYISRRVDIATQMVEEARAKGAVRCYFA